MSDDNKGERSPTNITHHLKGISFPASRDELSAHAEGNGADGVALEKIAAMPDETYKTMADVMGGFGKAS